MSGEYDWEEGLYATRHLKYKIDVPVKVWLHDGDRDEFGELESDQIWRAIWWPFPNSLHFFEVPMSARFWIFLRPITESEFEWLMTLKK